MVVAWWLGTDPGIQGLHSIESWLCDLLCDLEQGIRVSGFSFIICKMGDSSYRIEL